jgi:hypothetical protein
MELHNLYSSPDIIRIIQSEGEMGGACSTHGAGKKCTKFWSVNVKERYCLKDLGTDGK